MGKKNRSAKLKMDLSQEQYCDCLQTCYRISMGLVGMPIDQMLQVVLQGLAHGEKIDPVLFALNKDNMQKDKELIEALAVVKMIGERVVKERDAVQVKQAVGDILAADALKRTN